MERCLANFGPADGTVTVFVSGWVVLGGWKMRSVYRYQKLVLTGERHYTRNDDIRRAILALGAPGTLHDAGWRTLSRAD